MIINDLLQEIETLSPAQQESVYSFVYLLKNPDYLRASLAKHEKIEPFTNEREALDFANYCAGKVLNETR